MRLAALVFLLAGAAHANPFDAFGLGSRAMALGGALAGTGGGASAAHYNPAGAALVDDVTLAVGYSAADIRMSIDDRDYLLEPERGVELGVVVPWEVVPGWQLAFAAGLHLPDQRIVRVRVVPPSEPIFFMYDNRVHRIATRIALAFGSADVGFGAGFTILAATGGKGIVFETRRRIGYDRAVSDLDVSLVQQFAPVLSAYWRPFAGLRVGGGYSHDIGLVTDLTTHTKIEIGILQGDALIGVGNTSYYTPKKLILGAEWAATAALTLFASAELYLWSLAPPTSPELRLDVEVGIPITIPRPPRPDDHLEDQLVPRLGAEWAFELDPSATLFARAGYAYEGSPVPPQTGLTTYIDSSRHIATAGVGVDWDGLQPVLPEPVSLDAHFQLHVLMDRTTRKDAATAPLRTFEHAGRVMQGGLTATIRF